MANFEIAHQKTKLNEGGYTAHPNDNGNWTGGIKGRGVLVGTKYGISAPVLKEWLSRDPTAHEMKSLKESVALAIYKKNYWDRLRGDEINNQAFAEQIYDMGVNAGLGAAIKLAEEVVGMTPSKAATMYDELLNKINNA